MLDLVNDEFTSPENVKEIVKRWTEHAALSDSSSSVAKRPNSASEHEVMSASFFTQTKILLNRQGKLVMRDPTLYLGRMIAFLASNLFFCIVYVASRDRTQGHVISRMFNMMWCVGTPVTSRSHHRITLSRQKMKWLTHHRFLCMCVVLGINGVDRGVHTKP